MCFPILKAIVSDAPVPSFSLAQLIKARPKTRRGKARAPGASAASGAGTARGGARPARGGGAAAAGARGGRVPAIQQQQQQVPAQKVAAAEAFKIIVSNLPDDVEERAVRVNTHRHLLFHSH